jgi:hypothetical protein
MENEIRDQAYGHGMYACGSRQSLPLSVSFLERFFFLHSWTLGIGDLALGLANNQWMNGMVG